MRIITVNMEHAVQNRTPIAACIGYFDGMHIGHQQLISKTIDAAKKYNCESALITFDPDPWVAIKDIHDVQHLMTMRQRIGKAADLGIRNIVILHFTKEMSQLSPDDFYTRILLPCNLKALICGFDFHYGFKGAGDAVMLKNHADFEVDVIPAVEDEKGKISSTRITGLIQNGNVTEAAELLGGYYEIEGNIIHGRAKGTKIGFPTANVDYCDENILPKPGVYACYAYINGKKFKAMVNLGHNPTMNFSKKLSLEAHIIDFDDSLYGKRVSLQFVKYLRPEMHFQCVLNLQMQLEQDLKRTRSILK